VDAISSHCGDDLCYDRRRLGRVAERDGLPATSNRKVQARLRELQERVVERLVEKVFVDKEWVINKLIENAERAMQQRAVRSEEGEEIGEFFALHTLCRREFLPTVIASFSQCGERPFLSFRYAVS
jgi:hypothetical protein